VYKPIISNEKVDIDNLIFFIKRNLKKSFKLSFFVVSLLVIYFFTKTPSYSAKVSFYTNYESKNTSSLSSSVFDSFSLSDTNLEFSVSDYIQSEDFLLKVVEKNYLIEGEKKTLSDYWGTGYNNFFILNPIKLLSQINQYFMLNQNLSIKEKKIYYAKKILSSRLSLAENRESKLYTITLSVRKDPFLAEEIVGHIYNSIIEYSNEVVNIKAIEKSLFIEQRIVEAKEDLEKAENEMLVFLENNIKINSPFLALERERIQRNITLYSQVYRNLSDQLELSKIDEKDNTSSIFLLDTPQMSNSKAGFSLIDFIFIALLFSFISVFSYEAYRNRNHLFIISV